MNSLILWKQNKRSSFGNKEYRGSVYAIAYTLKMSYKGTHQIDNIDWAVKKTSEKKNIDCFLAEYFTYKEGLCVQIMHHKIYLSDPRKVNYRIGKR